MSIGMLSYISIHRQKENCLFGRKMTVFLFIWKQFTRLFQSEAPCNCRTVSVLVEVLDELVIVFLLKSVLLYFPESWLGSFLMDVKSLYILLVYRGGWGLGEGLSSLNIQYKDYSFTDILLAAISVALLEATEYFKFLIIYFLYNFMCRMFRSTCIMLYIVCF